jgi:hypothetical protein
LFIEKCILRYYIKRWQQFFSFVFHRPEAGRKKKMKTQYVDGKGRDRKKESLEGIQERDGGVKNHETRRTST